jgi:hypothetical protein
VAEGADGLVTEAATTVTEDESPIATGVVTVTVAPEDPGEALEATTPSTE